MVYAAMPRRALIVQDDVFERTASVTVVPFTMSLTDAPLLRIRVASSEVSGLERDSDVMLDKLTTVRRGNVHTRVGRLSTQRRGEWSRGGSSRHP